MLPAYQGVFSTKTLTAVGASNGLNFDGVDDRVISTNDVKFQINVGTIEGWIKTGDAGVIVLHLVNTALIVCIYLIMSSPFMIGEVGQIGLLGSP